MPSFDALREYASLGYHIENGKLQLLSSYLAALEPSVRLTEVRVGRPASMQTEAEELLLSCSDGSTLIYGAMPGPAMKVVTCWTQACPPEGRTVLSNLPSECRASDHASEQ